MLDKFLIHPFALNFLHCYPLYMTPVIAQLEPVHYFPVQRQLCLTLKHQQKQSSYVWKRCICSNFFFHISGAVPTSGHSLSLQTSVSFHSPPTFTNTHNSRDTMRMGRAFIYSWLVLPSTHRHQTLTHFNPVLYFI